MLSEAGLASQEAIATAFSVNGSEPTLRLVVQHLDEAWEEQNFETTGWLFKSEAEGDWSYRGADPASYVDVFDQETGDENLTPLIEFLDFLNNSSNEEFTAQLPQWLDVESFATYLAYQDLIGNFDDIDGPGNNSYLRWDAENQQFTVVAWDHNLAFGASPGAMGNPAGGQNPGGPPGRDGQRPQRPDAESMPTPPEMPGEFPTDLPQPEPGTAPGQPGQAGLQRSNVLADRFREVPEFSALISEAESRLQAELIDSGRASELLAERTALLNEHPDLVDSEVVTSEAESIRRMLS